VKNDYDLLKERVDNILELRKASTDPRTKVAAALYEADRVLPEFYGVNCNTCVEDAVYMDTIRHKTDPYSIELSKYDVTTHAEALCIDMWKISRTNKDAEFFFLCTHYPCIECMKNIITSWRYYGLHLLHNSIHVLPYSTVQCLGQSKAQTLAKAAGLNVVVVKENFIPVS
jgi:hypothetical protein